MPSKVRPHPNARPAYRGRRNAIDERAQQPFWARDLEATLLAAASWQIRAPSGLVRCRRGSRERDVVGRIFGHVG